MSETRETGWLGRLRAGLERSSSRLAQSLSGVVSGYTVDDTAVAEIEDALILADLGPATAARLATRLRGRRIEGDEDADMAVREAIAEDIAKLLEPVARPMRIEPAHRPHVILVVGVNGSGKTTTIGKLAKRYKDEGLTVSIAAGDTFRAAAVEQLKIWGARTGCPVTSRETGADAAGLAFDALAEAQDRGDDLLLIDTAGRLQNKTELMDELQKIARVLSKRDPTAPHDVLLVLDATTGQNALSQVEAFKAMAEVSGLVVTKLDGSAKGGVLVALADRFGLPVHAIGVGEQVEDLQPFEARDFARSLLGLEAG